MEKQCTLGLVLTILTMLSPTTTNSITIAKSPHLNNFTDQNALLALKDHISDPHGILPQSWTTNTSFCNWLGVSCAVRHQRVRALNLAGMDLVGTLTPEIGNLSFLQLLNINYNKFHGSLPRELGHLHRLRIITMQANNFSGQIPVSIGNLQQLEILSLGENMFEGNIPSAVFNMSSVRVINLGFNGLTGTLPGDICGRLPKIEMISLNTNELGGPIPFNLTSCIRLQIFSLSYNNFLGRIPDELQKLTMLQKLHLGGNTLTGEIPPAIFNLTSVMSIAFQKNQLSGRLPKDTRNMSSLVLLNAWGNKFTGTIPQGIGHLPNLKRLYLSNNTLTGEIPHTLLNSSNLEILDLGVNGLSSNLPSTLGLSLPNLQFLYLAGNQLAGMIPNSISNASRLKEIELDHNLFTGSVLRTLGNLLELDELTLQVNYLTNEPSSTKLDFLTSLTNCRHLKTLWLESNMFNGELPNTVGNLSNSLQSFSAFDNEMKGRIPEEIGNLTNLIELELATNELVGPIPKSIGKLSKLQTLLLFHNELNGSIPSSLCLSTTIGILVLGENKLTGSIPHCLGNMTSLREISLDSNQLTSIIPATLGYIENLVLLSLNLNHLSGPIPVEIGNLKFAVEVDLSNNQLSGEIPSSINGLQMLVNLSFSNNRLQGPIPASIGKLENLELLDLSRNSLSGSIPKELETLSYLKYVNLSFNRLQGEIPSRGPFVNFTAASFLGNPGLCGTPRLQVPTCVKQSKTKARTLSRVLKIVIPSATSALLLLALILFLIKRKRRGGDAPVPKASINVIALRRFSRYEILTATNKLGHENLIGTGAFGSVYKAIFSDELVAAIKVFHIHVQEAFHSFDAECEILKNIRHRHLIKVISSCSNLDFKALVLEYMPNGNLDTWLHSDGRRLDLVQRLNTMIDVASAIEYLHHGHLTPVVHRDLKPSNVLLDEDMVAHVSDFGLAKMLDEGQSTILSNNLATIGYMAPEYGSEGLVSTKADVYSYGIMLMETFTGKRPTDSIFEGDMSLKHWVAQSLSNLGEIIDMELLGVDEERFHQVEEQCVKSVMELALNCTSETPSERMNMNEVVTGLNKIKTKLVPTPRRRIQAITSD